MEPVADERKNKKADRAEGKNRGDGVGGIFIVRINRAFGGDDGGDAADRRADGEQRGEFWRQTEGTAEIGHKNEG